MNSSESGVESSDSIASVAMTTTPKDPTLSSTESSTPPGTPTEAPKRGPGRPRKQYDKTNPVFGEKPPARKRKGRRPVELNETTTTSIAAMEGLGLKPRQIARAIKVSPQTVYDVMKRPETQEFAREIREAIRDCSLAEARRANQGAWTWLQQIIAQRDPKAFDSVTRGLFAVEKIAASAAGETRTIERTITAEAVGPHDQAKQMLSLLLSETRGP